MARAEAEAEAEESARRDDRMSIAEGALDAQEGNG
jgi:hypothetical protein